jgi:hypothetical protein
MSESCSTRGKIRKAYTVLFEKAEVTRIVQRPVCRWVLSTWECGTDSNGVVWGPKMDFCEHHNNHSVP